MCRNLATLRFFFWWTTTRRPGIQPLTINTKHGISFHSLKTHTHRFTLFLYMFHPKDGDVLVVVSEYTDERESRVWPCPGLCVMCMCGKDMLAMGLFGRNSCVVLLQYSLRAVVIVGHWVNIYLVEQFLSGFCIFNPNQASAGLCATYMYTHHQHRDLHRKGRCMSSVYVSERSMFVYRDVLDEICRKSIRNGRNSQNAFGDYLFRSSNICARSMHY